MIRKLIESAEVEMMYLGAIFSVLLMTQSCS